LTFKASFVDIIYSVTAVTLPHFDNYSPKTQNIVDKTTTISGKTKIQQMLAS